jgi:hypothetical protein
VRGIARHLIDVRNRCQVKDGVAAGDGAAHGVRVTEITQHGLDLSRRMVRRFDEVEDARVVPRGVESVDDV